MYWDLKEIHYWFIHLESHSFVGRYIAEFIIPNKLLFNKTKT